MANLTATVSTYQEQLVTLVVIVIGFIATSAVAEHRYYIALVLTSADIVLMLIISHSYSNQ